MKRIIIRYKDRSFKVNISKDNTCILDSYTVYSIKDMIGILYEIQDKALEEAELMAVHKRTVLSMVNEWRVHNLLYSLNIQRHRTKNVDLDINQPWYMKIIYTILSPFYLHFSLK